MDLLAQTAAGFATVAVDEAIKERALAHMERWLTDPAFASYRPQIEWLIAEKAWAGLLDRFYQILPFGTGGRRGAVGIGPNRMNPWTLTASVQGHCAYLRERFPGRNDLAVAVAYDVRRFEDVRRQYHPGLPNPVLHLSSRDLAHRAVEVYAANGIASWTLPPDSPRYLATPELSFVIRRLGVHGGLNLSASHNPPDDNGGKFYDERGAQPVPPEDQIMADLVDQVREIHALPWAEALRSGLVKFLDDATHQAYIELCARQSLIDSPRPGEMTVVFTPLHGVGGMTAQEVLEAKRFRVVPVEEQMTPDGMFPNTTSSNPETPASMDRAAALAARLPAADLILSTDPDADRIGTMIPARAEAGGAAWRFVTGNELAALLTHFKLEQLALQGRMPPSPLVLTTEVTTGLVTRIAHKFGCQVVNDLLVGFKYMADVLYRLERDGAYGDVRGRPEDMVIATEESHGVMMMPQIRDKDAAAGALIMAELALYQKRRGLTVLDYLEQIVRELGYFHNRMQPLVMTGILGKKQMHDMLNSLRREPPAALAGLRVTSFEDLLREDGRMGPLLGETDALGRNFLILRLGGDDREGIQAKVVLRPSGTEPKAKAYIEVSSPPCPPRMSPADWKERCRRLDQLAERMAAEFLELAMKRVA